MKRSIFSLSLIIVASTLFAPACSRYGTSRAKSPSQIVIAAYMTANEGRYSETVQYYSAEITVVIQTIGAIQFMKIWDKKTRDGKIEKIEILKEEIRGEGATVRFKLHFKKGETRSDDVEFIKEGRLWKLITFD